MIVSAVESGECIVVVTETNCMQSGQVFRSSKRGSQRLDIRLLPSQPRMELPPVGQQCQYTVHSYVDQTFLSSVSVSVCSGSRSGHILHDCGKPHQLPQVIHQY